MESHPNSGLTAVTPVLPVAPYIGGKKNLAKRICALIAATPHRLYAEPFVGMGGIFLRRRFRPKSEVINDRNREVANLFRVVQRHYVPFLEMMRFQITTRAEFERLVKTPADTLTDLERAARFLYLQRTGFGGKVAGTAVFGVSPDRPARFDVTKVGPMLEDLHARLVDVTIECLDFGDFLQRYDRAHTLFYLDPPYWGSESDYGKELFSRADFERLRDVLRGLKGRFMMSLNDVPEVRELFGEFDIEAVDTTYSIAKAGNKRVGEVIIRGGAS